jgi:hypothetical protein
MWCPITQSKCYPYDSCAFKDKEDIQEQKCLITEALKVYITNNQLLKAYNEQNPPKYKEHWWD